MYPQVNRPPGFINKFNLFAGVIVPIIAITVEARTHLSAQLFFDPLPTPWHLMLAIFVPLAQLQVWFAIRRGAPDRLKLAGWVNAIAIGISIFYALVCVPMLPIAALTLLILVGLLPFSPFLAVLTAILMRKQLRQVAAKGTERIFSLTARGLLAGFGITIAAIGLIELPAAVTRYGLQMVLSNSAETRAEGIRFLRYYGSNDYLIRSCFGQTPPSLNVRPDLFWFQNPIGEEEARQIYYRVTGETFDMSAPPLRVGPYEIPQDTFDFKTDQGGTTTAGKLKNLSLFYSEIDGSVDADGGVGYLQWTLVFQNDAESEQEARAELQLPPGAVVSHLTFSRQHSEHEIAFTRRSEDNEDEKWSPVKIMTSGVDRVVVQTAVPALSHDTKVRLGITVPVVLERRDQARLILPHFARRNFRIPDVVNHSVWLQAKYPLSTDYNVLTHYQRSNDSFVLFGNLSDASLSDPQNTIRLVRVDSDRGIWSRNPFETDRSTVRQWVEERTPVHLRRLVIVVDTSESMEKWEHEINAALLALPIDMDVHMVLASADRLDESRRKTLEVNSFGEMPRHLAAATFAGGADNVPALRRAWDLAVETPGNNAVVWIHSPQVIELERAFPLRQRMEESPFGPVLYSVHTTNGADEIEKQLDGVNQVKTVPRVGTLRSDLERLFRQLSGQIKTYEFVRSVAHSDIPFEPPPGYETSDHLARLWARDEVSRILNAHDIRLTEAAAPLAVRYQLVTPISGLGFIKPYRTVGDFNSCIDRTPSSEFAAILLVITIVWIGWACIRFGRPRRGGCIV
jgi:hypothetical protein